MRATNTFAFNIDPENWPACRDGPGPSSPHPDSHQETPWQGIPEKSSKAAAIARDMEPGDLVLPRTKGQGFVGVWVFEERAEITDRLNEYYEQIHRLSVLILEASYFESLGAGPRQFDRLLIDMRTLFEHVVFRGFVTVFDDVASQVEGDGAPPSRAARSSLGCLLTDNPQPGESGKGELQRLEPDVFLTTPDRNPDVLLVGDAKWKELGEAPNRNDLYQLNAYQSYADVPGLIIYPALSDDGTTYSYQSADDRGATSQQLAIIGLGCGAADSYESFRDGVTQAIRRGTSRLLD